MLARRGRSRRRCARRANALRAARSWAGSSASRSRSSARRRVDTFARVAHQRRRPAHRHRPGRPVPRSSPVTHPRVPWVPALHDLDGPVVVDVGRVRGGAPTRALLDHGRRGAAGHLAGGERRGRDGRVAAGGRPGVAGRAGARRRRHPGRGGRRARWRRLRASHAARRLGEQLGRVAAVGAGDGRPGAPRRVLDDRRLRRSPLVAAARRLATAVSSSRRWWRDDRRGTRSTGDRRAPAVGRPLPRARTATSRAAERELREEITRDVLRTSRAARARPAADGAPGSRR